MSQAMIQADILQDTASPAVARVLELVRRPRPILQRAAAGANRTLRDWFLARPPNRRGWPSSGLWRDIAAATGVAEVTDTQATVAISHPAILQKVYGGDIVPKRGRMLAIAATPEAYQAGSPREGAHPTLKRMLGFNEEIGRWMWCLFAEGSGTKQVKDRRKAHKGEMKTIQDPRQPAGVWYWLVSRVHQEKDAQALPPPAMLSESMLASILAYLGTQAGARSQIGSAA